MSKPIFSKSHLWAAAMALGLLLGCQSHNAYGPGKDAGADGQKTLAGVVSYIRQHEQRMPYLQERNFSANDLVVSKADCSITGDTIYVKIPFVRPLRDSLATADSLFFAPRRIFAWARIIKGRSQPELRFIELDPTRDYHKVNRTRIRYQAFSGEMNFFNEDGTNEYSAVWVDGHIVSDTLRQSPVDDPKHGRRPDRKARRR